MVVVKQGKKPVIYEAGIGIFESNDLRKVARGSDYRVDEKSLFQGSDKLGTYSSKMVAAEVLIELLKAEEAGVKVFYMPDADNDEGGC